MTQPASASIDVSVTRKGRLVLLADGASADDQLRVRLSGDALEIADARGPVVRAVGVPAAAVAQIRARSTAFVVLLRDGQERLHHGVIEGNVCP